MKGHLPIWWFAMAIRWSGHRFILPRQVRHQFSDPGGMEGVVALGGEHESSTWEWATAGAFCDGTTTLPFSRNVVPNKSNSKQFKNWLVLSDGRSFWIWLKCPVWMCNLERCIESRACAAHRWGVASPNLGEKETNKEKRKGKISVNEVQGSICITCQGMARWLFTTKVFIRSSKAVWEQRGTGKQLHGIICRRMVAKLVLIWLFCSPHEHQTFRRCTDLNFFRRSTKNIMTPHDKCFRRNEDRRKSKPLPFDNNVAQWRATVYYSNRNDLRSTQTSSTEVIQDTWHDADVRLDDGRFPP